MKTKVLIVYGTRYGATAQIAERISETLLERGVDVDLFEAGRAPDPAPYSAVVIGSAVYIGRWRREVSRFLKSNEKALSEKPVFLFSSGPTGEGDPVKLTRGWSFPGKLKPVADRIAPRDIALFHGAIDTDNLNFLSKWMIRKVEAPSGDYRDWRMIESWASGIADDVKRADSAQ